MRARALVLLAIAGPGMAACGSSGSPEAARGAGPVVARWGDLEVTAGEVDDRIVALPASERPRPGASLDDWYRSQIREVVVERRLAREALDAGLADSDEFEAARDETRKQLVLQLCVAKLAPRAASLSDEEVRAVYDERSFSAPERRAAFHIFIRATPEERVAARDRIDALRDRVLGGESFQLLAGKYSDSETRHRSGALDVLVRGQLPPGFDEVVFGLEEGVPSEPVETRDGFHLFYVERIMPARTLSFEEARGPLRERMLAERQESALAELVSGIEAPPGSLVLDRQGLAEVANRGDGQAVVLRVADSEITLDQLRQRVRLSREAGSERGKGQPPPNAWRMLELLRRRELLFHHCSATRSFDEQELAEGLEHWRQRALPALQRRRRMLELARSDEARLKLFYESNPGQFSTPPRWHLRRLRVPLAGRATENMARLEQAATSGAGLDRLQADLGGEIEDLDFRAMAELQRIEPKLPPLVAPLRPGQLSAPYRTKDSLEIVAVVAKTEAVVQPYAEVREAVAAAYVSHYTHEVYAALTEELLETHELEIVTEGLQALREAGLAEADVSIEEIEALFDEP